MVSHPHPLTLSIPRTWEEPIHLWLLWLQANNFTHAIQDTRERHLRRLARELKLHPSEVTWREITNWATQHSWTHATKRSYYASIKGFFQWYSRYYELPNNVAVLPRVTVKEYLPRPIPEDILEKSLHNCPPRVELILRLAAELGLRASEIAQIHQRTSTLAHQYLLFMAKEEK